MDIKQALLAFTPELESSYQAYVTRQFNAIQAELGPTFKGVFNSWPWARIYRETVSRNVTVDVSGPERIYTLDARKMNINAQSYASVTVLNWVGKITAKMTGLENPEVQHLSGYTFRITGTRNGKAVSIQQDMILNVSSKGKLFNQFPARIYVDGKFTSEAKYKAL